MSNQNLAHWLYRFTPEEWLRGAIKEFENAREAFSHHVSRTGLANARRAAGMAWNAVLALEEQPEPRFGRSYADHLNALARNEEPTVLDSTPIPKEVYQAAQILMNNSSEKSRDIVAILIPRHHQIILDAAEIIVAEAYTRVLRQKPSLQLALTHESPAKIKI